MKNLFIATTLLSNITMGFAEQNFKIEQPKFIGTGCNANNTVAEVSSDGQAITALFQGYVAEAGGETGEPFILKNCNIHIPVQLAEGYSLSVYKVDFAGYATVPQAGSMKFSADILIPGTDRVKVEKNITSPFNDAFMTESLYSREYWSECGKKVILGVSSTLIVNSNNAGDAVIAGIDSADAEAGLKYNIKVKKCGTTIPVDPVEPQPHQTVELINYISNVYSDSFATTQNPPSTYVVDESLGHIYTAKMRDTIALKSCMSTNSSGKRDQFANVNCGSGREISVLGYIDVFKKSDNRPLYFCYSRMGNRFLALDSSCNSQSDRNGALIGYVKR